MKNPGYVGRTLILLKPDAIERNLAGEILKRFERKGLKIVAAQLRWPEQKLAEQHYQEHKGNSAHFKNMTYAISRGPVLAVVLEGTNIIECSRQLIGQPSISHSQAGTIRADFANDDKFNLVHGSDSPGAAKREITLWFDKNMVHPNVPVIESMDKADMPEMLHGKWVGGSNPPNIIATMPVMPLSPPKKLKKSFADIAAASSNEMKTVTPTDLEAAKKSLASLISDTFQNQIGVEEAMNMINTWPAK